MEMTPRQRWLAVLERRQPDRIVVDYWSTPELHQRLRTDLNCPDDEALWRRLHIDRPRGVGPRWKLKHHPDDPKAGTWGTRHVNIDYGTGTYGETCYNPLAAAAGPADVQKFRWPSPDDFDYAGITEFLNKDDGLRLIQGGGYEPFLLYCSMRGLEQAFEDVLVNTEIVEAALGHIFDFFFEHNRRIFEAATIGGRCRIDLFYLAEDLGGQAGPLFSLDVYRRFLLPNQKKMADLCRRYGVHVIYHTDGAARVFLPDLVDQVGIEILNPIQWRCPGMEREGLVRDFGKKIGFHGAMDNQQTMPFGTVDDVVREVKDNLRLFRDGGARWICAPCHNLQPVTPTRNVVAMYETIWEVGVIA